MAIENLSSQAYRETTKLFWRATLRRRGLALGALLSPISGVFVSVLVPFFASRVMQGLVTHNSSGSTLNLIYLSLAAVIGVFFNRIGFTRFMVLIATCMSDLQEMVFARLLARGTSYHSNQVSGKLVSDALDFVSAYNILAGAVVVTGLPFFIIILTGLAIVFLNSVVLGFYLIAVVVITVVWAIIESRTRDKLRTHRLQATRALTAHTSDSIVNAQTVKTFAGENFEIDADRRLNHKLRDLRIKDWQRSGRSGANRLGALLAMQVIMLYILTRLNAGGANVLATSIFAFTYVFTITTRLFSINDMIRQIEDAYLQASPMSLMLTEPLEVLDAADARDLQVHEASIVLNKIRFHYSDATSDQTVFAGLNLSIHSGERVGLVGPSGGGKSTLTRLLLRFEDVDEGEILISGQNIARVTQMSLRRAIAYVPQEPLLFHRTIRDNIAYGNHSAKFQEVVEAAKKAHAHEFIEDLPRGYDTVVGERGIKLSGGQRQRVAIARAILKDAPILVLDEATSALDSESEVMIQQALWALMKDRTAIVIAHRLSTIAKMDRIIVLDDGKIREQGSHADLLAHEGLYARLWQHQSGGFLED